LLIAVAGVLIVAGAIAATLILTASVRRSAAFRAYLGDHFRPRPDCPVADPFLEGSVVFDCFDGALPSGRPVALVLGHEPGSRANVWSYIGLFVPDGPGVGAARSAFAARVRARGDWWGRRAGGAPETHVFVPPPDAEPVRADAVPGGAFIAWRLTTLPTAEKLTARLSELDQALTGGP
jgi:hypothetical protein